MSLALPAMHMIIESFDCEANQLTVQDAHLLGHGMLGHQIKSVTSDTLHGLLHWGQVVFRMSGIEDIAAEADIGDKLPGTDQRTQHIMGKSLNSRF